MLALTSQVTHLEEENRQLRQALADCANHVGAVASPRCSLDFLLMIPREVQLVIERLRKAGDDVTQIR
ncbi:hypothetical protein [Paraburkholderia phenoliruptrix]|uniref:hypothetical protein n=1 Tax=Paraburkholderia phenoliruptrix TaxID=252970 RepID=UPI0034CF4225